jgi:hypothetical protein
MALQEGKAGSSEYIVDTSYTICWSCGQFVACAVETSIKYFIIVTSEGFYALSAGNIPKFASSVNASSQAIISSKVKLPAWQLSSMSLQCEDTLPRANIPNLGSIIKGSSQEFITVSVEIQWNYFCLVSSQIENFLSSFHIP